LTETIARFEPRVSLKNILVENDDYGITIKLDYVILNVGRASSLITTIARTA
jgi:predicted component of type VI protein secretion system